MLDNVEMWCPLRRLCGVALEKLEWLLRDVRDLEEMV
jgi:hypothetical protein